MYLRTGATASPDIVIVAIDDDSIDYLGRFPWPRDIHARMIENLAEAGAAVIAIDLVFTEPALDQYEDEELAAAVRQAGNVILPVQAPIGMSTESAVRAGGELVTEYFLFPLPGLE